jgi:hypothetical protein
MATWEEAAQGWANTFVGTASQIWGGNAAANQQAKLSNLELQKMQMQAYSQWGTPYVEGQANGASVGLPTSWLLMGGLLVAFFVMKD